MLYREADGSLAPLGQIRTVLSTDGDYGFQGGTLPDWLSDDSDAGASLSPSPLAYGGVQLTTATTANNRAQVTAPQVDLRAVDAVRLDVTITGAADGTAANFLVGFVGGGDGAWAIQPNGTDRMYVNTRYAGVTTRTDIHYRALEPTERYTIGILITCTDSRVYVLEGNDVYAAIDAKEIMSRNVVTPVIRWTTLDGSEQVRHLHRVQLERWWR